MTAAYISLGAVSLLLGVYLFAIFGRTKNGRMDHLKKLSYAHRGLHGNGIPENSMAAFRAALDGGYGIELDVHLLKDGNLAVIHDSTLIRTTGCDGRIEELTIDELTNYRLEGTDETIPTFEEVVKLFAGKAPLIVELKPENGNHAELTQAACALLDQYRIDYCMESFDPRCISWLRKNRPEIIRGQLSENYYKTKDIALKWYFKFLLTNQMMNFATRPDFIAYRFADRKDTLSNIFCRAQMESVTWTIKNQEDFDIAVKEGWIPIFEGFRP